MNCQPFEEWLLNDKKLSEEEKRELDSHLRGCARCAALFETGLVLSAACKATPPAGFVQRFETRLSARRITESRQRLWGFLLLILTGAGLLLWLATPLLQSILSSPAEWLASIVSYFLFAVTTAQVFAQLLPVFFNLLLGILPPYAWMVFASALAGFSLLWTVSIWRFSRAPQGVFA